MENYTKVIMDGHTEYYKADFYINESTPAESIKKELDFKVIDKDLKISKVIQHYAYEFSEKEADRLDKKNLTKFTIFFTYKSDERAFFMTFFNLDFLSEVGYSVLQEEALIVGEYLLP